MIGEGIVDTQGKDMDQGSCRRRTKNNKRPYTSLRQREILRAQHLKTTFYAHSGGLRKEACKDLDTVVILSVERSQ